MRYLMTANAPKDGRIVSQAETAQAVNRYYGTNVGLREHPIEPGSSFIEGLADAGSSDAEGAAIAIVVIGVLLSGLVIGDVLRNALL